MVESIRWLEEEDESFKEFIMQITMEMHIIFIFIRLQISKYIKNNL